MLVFILIIVLVSDGWELVGASESEDTAVALNTTIANRKGLTVVRPAPKVKYIENAQVRTNMILDAATIRPKFVKVNIPPPTPAPVLSIRPKNRIIDRHRIIELSSNKTLDLSNVVVSFLYENGAKIVNVSTSVGNYDDFGQLLAMLSRFNSKEVDMQLIDYVTRKYSASAGPSIIRSWFSDQPDLMISSLFNLPSFSKKLFNAKEFQSAITKLDATQLDRLLELNFPTATLSHFFPAFVMKHNGYLTAFVAERSDYIVQQMEHFGRLDAFKAKFCSR